MLGGGSRPPAGGGRYETVVRPTAPAGLPRMSEARAGAVQHDDAFQASFLGARVPGHSGAEAGERGGSWRVGGVAGGGVSRRQMEQEGTGAPGAQVTRSSRPDHRTVTPGPAGRKATRTLGRRPRTPKLDAAGRTYRAQWCCGLVDGAVAGGSGGPKTSAARHPPTSAGVRTGRKAAVADLRLERSGVVTVVAAGWWRAVRDSGPALPPRVRQAGGRRGGSVPSRRAARSPAGSPTPCEGGVGWGDWRKNGKNDRATGADRRRRS